MVFLDRNQVVGVIEHVPAYSEVHQSLGRLSTHVLEVPAGWARAHGVHFGQQVILPG